MSKLKTVREITYNLLRRLDMTIMVGNPGSTEETFLKNFPDDFTYIMALQESSVIGIADGLAQSLKKPVLVNVHTGAGMGNAMGCIITAFTNKTPLIITAGQQTREMLLMEPFLTNVDAVSLPKPWVKWSYEPCRPEDVPGAFMRAYATAIQQPTGPVFLSLPLDDWDKEIEEVDVFRTTSTRTAPDPQQIIEFAKIINQSKNPVLVYGGDVARSNAWDAGIAFAEKLNAPVWFAPFTSRIGFPQDHYLYAGGLPPAIGPMSEKLKGHDLIIVIGAPVFRYYPWVPGDYLPKGSRLLQITDSPYEAAKAVVGDSLISDSGLALIELAKQIKLSSLPRGLPRVLTGDGVSQGEPRAPLGSPSARTCFAQAKLLWNKIHRGLPRGILSRSAQNAFKKDVVAQKKSDNIKYPLTAAQLFEILSVHLPEDFILVQEAPSNLVDLGHTALGTVTKPDSYYTMSSGGLGWDMPAAVGLAIAEKRSGRNRPVILIIGDGSFQYSPQALWTAVQHEVHVVVVVLRNEEYGILKAFAMLEDTPNVPGLDLPGLDIVSLAKGFGAVAVLAKTAEEITATFQKALKEKKVTVIEVPTDKTIRKLLS